MSTIIEQLRWRYATQQYDAMKKISEANLWVLKESIRLAPSSYGLQPYKVIVVESPGLREQLFRKSYGQAQVKDASHYFVFAVQNTLESPYIDAYIDLVASTRAQEPQQLEGFARSMKSTTAGMTAEEQFDWNSKQAYIGLGNLLTTAALLHIDATPMEGFDSRAYNEILQLKDHTAVLAVALGYRSDEDAYQFKAKVRKESEHFFETV
ncbi:MAG TPA: NAD(P)H-dependent oxidoreductase [Fluviicola sp.]|nr:NAD(P)H-dependent oxidoreductase [Fluviicola sp.]